MTQPNPPSPASDDDSLPQVMSCGFLIFRDRQSPSFLLMEHRDRLDLPKGHVDPGETEMECALRELEEETGIREDQIEVDSTFRFELKYQVHYKKKFGGGPAQKTLLIFLAWLIDDTNDTNDTNEITIQLTEHQGSRWVPWQAGLRLQPMTIDPLLECVEQHWQQT